MSGPCFRNRRDPPLRISTREELRGTRIRKTAVESGVSTLSRSIAEVNDALPDTTRTSTSALSASET